MELEMKICLCTICGIPGSGKSSFCERLNDVLSKIYFIINVNYDEVLLSSNTDKIQFHQSLFAQDQNKKEDSFVKPARQEILKLVEVVIQNLRKHGSVVDFNLMDGHDNINCDVRRSFMENLKKHSNDNYGKSTEVLFLLDDNFYLSSMRYDFYKLAKHYETGFCEILMDCCVEKALERNRTRQGRDFVHEDVIVKMASKIEPPDYGKNHWEKYNLKMTTEDEINMVLPMVKEAFSNPIQLQQLVSKEEQAQSQAACSASLIHQADLILRQCVGKIIENGKKNLMDIKSLSRMAVKEKEVILTSLKSGHMIMPLVDSFSVEDASKNEKSDLYKYLYDVLTERLKD